MTTDAAPAENGAVATADTEVTPQTQVEQPVEADTEVTPTGAGEEGAGAPSTETSEGTEGADAVPASLDDVFKPYEAGQLKPEGGETPGSPDSGPGIPLEEFEKTQKQNRAYRHAVGRQNLEGTVVRELVAAGLTEDEARASWNARIRGVANDIVSGSDDYGEFVDGFVVGKLPEEVKTEFNKKVYPNKQAWVEGLVDTGRRLERAAVEAQKKSGDLIDKKTHEKALIQAGRDTRANLERWLESMGIQVGQSGNKVSGASPRSFANEDAVHTAFNDGNLTPTQYKAALKPFGVDLE